MSDHWQGEGEIGQVGAGYEVASENLDRGVEEGKSVSVQETSMPGAVRERIVAQPKRVDEMAKEQENVEEKKDEAQHIPREAEEEKPSEPEKKPKEKSTDPPESQFVHLGPSKQRYTILRDEFQLSPAPPGCANYDCLVIHSSDTKYYLTIRVLEYCNQ